MSGKTLLVVYEHGRIDRFDPEDAEYWIQRRLEKEGIEPVEAWIAEPFDFVPIVDAYHQELAKQALDDQEAKDRREYERLKRKFGATEKPQL